MNYDGVICFWKEAVVETPAMVQDKVRVSRDNIGTFPTLYRV